MPPVAGPPGARPGRQEVVVRALSDPVPGWSLADAVRLAEQGYQSEQVQRMTGWHPAQVRAAQVRAARARVAGPERAGPAERG